LAKEQAPIAQMIITQAGGACGTGSVCGDAFARAGSFPRVKPALRMTNSAHEKGTAEAVPW